MDSNWLAKCTTETAEFLRPEFGSDNLIGIILGTGSGLLADQIQSHVSIDYREIPHFPTSTALGHKGRLVGGHLAGTRVIAMQGRFHLYEGYDIDLATLPVRVMRQLGVETLFVSNASGGLNPKFARGEIMMIDSHVDFMFRTSTSMAGSSALGRPSLHSDAYDQSLIANAMQCARKNDFNIQRGVYAALLGPNYETRAEYRMLRKIGADVAGMSTVPEVTVAATLGMKILGFSIVTNLANPDQLDATTAQQVVEAAETAAPHLQTLVVDAIEFLAAQNLADSASP